MQIKQHRKLLIVIAICLGLLTLGISALLLTTGPRVRLFTSTFDTKKDALTYNESLVLHFDRPIKQKDYSSQVSITPEIDFEVSSRQQQLEILLKENLKSDTEYKVSVKENAVVSSTGVPMKSSYSKTVQSGAPSFMYLRRDVTKDNSSVKEDYLAQTDEPDSADDQIILSDLNKNEKIMHSSKTIRNFAVSSTYIYIAQYDQEKDEDEIVIINRKDNNKKKTHSLSPQDGGAPAKDTTYIPKNARIKKIVAAPKSNQMLFTISFNYSKFQDSKNLWRYNDAVFSIDAVSGKLTPFFTDEKKATRLATTDLQISRDGQAILVSDYDQTYAVTSAYNESSAEVIGSFDLSGGFNRNGSQILFFDKASLVVYYSDKEKSRVLNTSDEAFEGKFLNSSDNVVYRDLNDSVITGNYRLVKFDRQTNKSKTIWQADDEIIDSFTSSYDDLYFSIQQRNFSCSNYFKVEFNELCRETTTKIIDSQGKQRQEVSGINLTWLP